MHRILVVDDNHDTCDLLATLLDACGHEVEKTYSSSSVLAHARRFKPDVFVIDLAMPGMTGFELAERLRASPEFKDALLLAVSGLGQPEVQRRCKAVGFTRHFLKPVEIEELSAFLDDEKDDENGAEDEEGDEENFRTH